MYDITVYGAGIFGLSIAYAALSHGAKVQVIDPRGVGQGASGGIVGALAPHVPENWNDKKQFQFESLIYAQSFWPEVEAATGMISGYGAKGRLQPIVQERQIALAYARAENAKTLWQGKASWEVLKTRPDHPLVPQSPTGHYIHDTLSARIDPARACAALAAACKGKGAVIVEDGTPQGEVVEATGWWGLVRLSEECGQMVGNGVKGQAALLQFDAGNSAQIFADALHIIPHENGTVAVGSTSEREFADPVSTDAGLDAVLERVRILCPALSDAQVIRRWAGVRPRAKTRAPMLGRHPHKNRHWIANGGFKIGLGIAPLASKLMAEAVLEGRDVIPPFFDPAASFD